MKQKSQFEHLLDRNFWRNGNSNTPTGDITSLDDPISSPHRCRPTIPNTILLDEDDTFA